MINISTPIIKKQAQKIATGNSKCEPISWNRRRIRLLGKFLHDFQKDPTAVLPVIGHTDYVVQSTIRDDDVHRVVSLSESTQFDDDLPGSYGWLSGFCTRQTTREIARMPG